MRIIRVFSDFERASVNLPSTGLFRAKVVLTHYRGFQMPHGERFDGWLERLFGHPSFKATCSTEQLYLDSYERSVHATWSFPTVALNLKFVHSGMPLIDPTRVWLRLRLTRGELCRSFLLYEMFLTEKMLSIVFWCDICATRESGFDLKDSLFSNLQLSRRHRWRPRRRDIWLNDLGSTTSQLTDDLGRPNDKQ